MFHVVVQQSFQEAAKMLYLFCK